MREYGGYIELDAYRLPMLHEGAVALNCGRSCLAYLIKAKKIRKIALPFFMCDSVFDLCRRYDVEMRFYHTDEKFMPQIACLEEDEWLYVMNYYGQLTGKMISALKTSYQRVILDNAQAYFDAPPAGVDTLYTCRKFFGVADGGFLYTDTCAAQEYPMDESFERMHFLLGRFERSASEFYNEYVANNDFFDHEPIRQMSKLTANLLHGIDYDFVKRRRSDNFLAYHEKLKHINQLDLRKTEGAFAYPLMIPNGAKVRKALQHKKIYIPTLWPNVLNEVPEHSLEFQMAINILPLPCDQRYEVEDIVYICNEIKGEA